MELELKHIVNHDNYGLEGLFLGETDIVTAINFKKKII